MRTKILHSNYTPIYAGCQVVISSDYEEKIPESYYSGMGRGCGHILGLFYDANPRLCPSLPKKIIND